MLSFLKSLKDDILRVDKWLCLFCFALSLTSLVLLYGIFESGYATSLDLTRRNLIVQAGAAVMGVAAALVLSMLDYELLMKSWVIHVPAVYFLMLLTFFIGVGAAARPNDKRWLIMPVVGVWLQPAELLKISFILVYALHITKLGKGVNSPQGIVSLGAHALLPVALVHIQGDTGTALLILFIAVAMLFASGISWKYVLGALVGACAMLPVLWFFILSDFQKDRILTLINQATADPLGGYYQQYQAKLAIATGGITGKGLLDVRHVYVPEMHTDFIFSFFCESFGFIGAFLLLVVVVAMCSKILFNATQAQDQAGALICTGVFAMIAFQTLINIGMCLSLLPVIGNTFPFLSYGGTSMLTNFLGIGLVLSVYKKRNKDLFTNA